MRTAIRTYTAPHDRTDEQTRQFLADPVGYHRAVFGAATMKDDNPPKDEPPKDDPYTTPATQADLDRILEARLTRERAKYSDHDALKAKAAQFDQLEDAKKSEATKAAERQAQLEQQAATSGLSAMRLEVALDKGLTKTQALRLVGKTVEELTADADQLLADFGAQKRAPARKPGERLRPADDPDDDTGPEETDPRKLAADIPLR